MRRRSFIVCSLSVLILTFGCATTAEKPADLKRTLILNKTKAELIKTLPAKLIAIDYVVSQSAAADNVISTEWKFLFKKQIPLISKNYYSRLTLVLTDSGSDTMIHIIPKFEMRHHQSANPMNIYARGHDETYSQEEYPWNFDKEMIDNELSLVMKTIGG
jgi:hypothetical protein